MSDPISLILHRDPDWLVVNKPPGMATHAGKPGELGVVEWLDLHLGITAHVVSRLDRDTSGALLLAMNPEAAARAQQIHESGTAVKVYEFFALCAATAPEPGTGWSCGEAVDGKPARTAFTCLEILELPDLKPVVRCRAEITRGRRHQIRRHAAAAGLPILGDDRYGGALFGRLCLHCREIRWPEIPHAVAAPLPAALAGLVKEPAADPWFALCRDRRGPWPAAVTDAFRVVHRDEIPYLPASLDIYGRWFDAVWYDENIPLEDARQALDPVLEAAARTWGLQGGVLRGHRRNPHAKALVGGRITIGEAPPRVFGVHEHGLRYQINLTRTQHTGLFLDQRDMRRLMALRAAGKRMANLFAYTCSFAVAAAAERAEVVFSVDTARPGLNTGKENFKLNGLTDTGIGKFILSDARKWLRRQLKKQQEKPREFRPLDLVVCDPPVFASSRDGGRFSLQKEWPWLSAAAARLLAADGTALFTNNHRGGDHAFYRDTLQHHFERVVDLRPPLDFPVQPGHPHHVRIFLCERPRPSVLAG